MLKFIGVAAASALLPKVADKVGTWCEGLFDYVFGGEEPTEVIKPKRQTTLRKSSDTTTITQEMALFIRQYHSESSDIGAEDAAELNKILGLDKSRASYTRIWHKSFDPYSLPKGGYINEQK